MYLSPRSKQEENMKKQFVTIMLGAAVTAASLFVPITSEAKTSPRMVSVHTTSGKAVQLRTMKVGGQTMILVPMSMACDVFHSWIGGRCLGGV
jgi:hypothetical protein